ncbi:MAG: excinuclease ABC subunit B, partial [Gammaproteobacteria bacterium]|nr:excinuclease ABC subunit B [Gammaproteobacteria bacterium]
NVHGRAILYADRMTGSMQRAIEETERRRQKQVAFNETHSITPRGIVKQVVDVMEGARAEGGAPLPKGKLRARLGKGAKKPAGAAQTPSIHELRPEQALRRMKQLESEMFKHARNLEFEEAARLRDEIEVLRRAGFGLLEVKAG